MFCIDSIYDKNQNKYINFCTVYDNLNTYSVVVVNTTTRERLSVTCKDIYDFIYRLTDTLSSFVGDEKIFGVSFSLGVITVFNEQVIALFNCLDTPVAMRVPTLQRFNEVRTISQDCLYTDCGNLYLDIIDAIKTRNLKVHNQANPTIYYGYRLRYTHECYLVVIKIKNLGKFNIFCTKLVTLGGS